MQKNTPEGKMPKKDLLNTTEFYTYCAKFTKQKFFQLLLSMLEKSEDPQEINEFAIYFKKIIQRQKLSLAQKEKKARACVFIIIEKGENLQILKALITQIFKYSEGIFSFIINLLGLLKKLIISGGEDCDKGLELFKSSNIKIQNIYIQKRHKISIHPIYYNSTRIRTFNYLKVIIKKVRHHLIFLLWRNPTTFLSTKIYFLKIKKYSSLSIDFDNEMIKKLTTEFRK